MKKFFEFFKLAFSESGVPSSKRVLGGIIIIDVLVCTTYIVFTNEWGDLIKDLLCFLGIIGGSMVGLSAVMSGFTGIKK